MSDVLSQSEIDALLNAINTGEMETDANDAGVEVETKTYDFRTANRFNKEQIKTLNIIYDTFSRLLSSYLSGTLRSMCTAEVTSVEELKYHEFVNALPTPVILSVIRMPPMTGSILLEMSPDLSYAFISRLLGGAPDKESALRTYTEIELVLLERIVRQLLPLFGESWEKVAPVNAVMDRIETSPQFAQVVAMNETVAIISVKVKLDDVEGRLSICLPHLALEPINQQLSTKFLYQTTENRELPPAHGDIQMRIESTPLDVTASFKETQAPVREILNLQAGDVIRLDHKTSEPLTLRVGHIPKFIADVGIREKRYAAKILEIIQKEDANDE